MPPSMGLLTVAPDLQWNPSAQFDIWEVELMPILSQYFPSGQALQVD